MNQSKKICVDWNIKITDKKFNILIRHNWKICLILYKNVQNPIKFHRFWNNKWNCIKLFENNSAFIKD